MKQSNEEKELAARLERRNKRPQRILAVDLDGTLATFDHWRGYNHIGKPIKKIIALVRKAAKEGAYIIIFTCRTTTADNEPYLLSLNVVAKWLTKNKVPFDKIWAGSGKPFANFYIDDSALNINCKECLKKL